MWLLQPFPTSHPQLGSGQLLHIPSPFLAVKLLPSCLKHGSEPHCVRLLAAAGEETFGLTSLQCVSGEECVATLCFPCRPQLSSLGCGWVVERFCSLPAQHNGFCSMEGTLGVVIRHWLLQRGIGTREFDSQTLGGAFCLLQHKEFRGICMSGLWRFHICTLMWNRPV